MDEGSSDQEDEDEGWKRELGLPEERRGLRADGHSLVFFVVALKDLLTL